MNSRILLIAFAIIVYLSVTKSAGLNPQPKDSVQAQIVSSTPSTNHSNAVNYSHADAVSQVPPQIPQKIATPQTPQVPQKIPMSEAIQSNLTDVKIEIHGNTTVVTTITPVEPNTTITTPYTTKSTTEKPTNTTPLPNSSTTAKSSTPPSHTGSTSAFEPTTSSNIPGRGRQFDGPSFIGGIVLTVGLTAIGFIAFKFYKAGKLDMSYRTL